MSGWRAALVAAIVGGLVLLAGYLVPRLGEDASGGTSPPVDTGGVALWCPQALDQLCSAVGEELGISVARFRTGVAPSGDAVVLAPAADLPEGWESGEAAARSPVAIAVWLERSGVLSLSCGGTVDLACLTTAYGSSWSDLGGNDSWGEFKLGLADPERGEAGLAAWRAIARDGVPARLADSLRLVSNNDGALMADLLLFGTARADAVVTTEVAIASQLANAPGRGGRLVVTYPDPAPWVEYVVASSGGRGPDRVADDLLSPEIQRLFGAYGLRPARAETVDLPDDLGDPGSALGALEGAARQTLLEQWTTMGR